MDESSSCPTLRRTGGWGMEPPQSAVGKAIFRAFAKLFGPNPAKIEKFIGGTFIKQENGIHSVQRYEAELFTIIVWGELDETI